MYKHLCFLHQNYPAQFGPISQFLMKEHGTRVSFVSQYRSRELDAGIHYIPYQPVKTGHEETPYFFARYYEQEVASMHGILSALQAQKLKPDAFVGHAAFGTMGLLHCTYPDVPKIGYFELFYDITGAESDSRPEFPAPLPNRVRVPLRNATQLVELLYCQKGYSPTKYQRSTYPAEFQSKLAPLFDGIDTSFYAPLPSGDKTPVELKPSWPGDAKVVTFVSRGLEALRGFDIFMDVAEAICQKRSDVHFVVAGRPKTHYGSEMIHIKSHDNFKDYVLSRKNYDLSRFHFMDWVSETALRDIFRLSDCHLYWSTPFTLSWSLFQALSTGVVSVASRTSAIEEIIHDGTTGYLVDPYDKDAIVDKILSVLDAPEAQRPIRANARSLMVEHYDFSVCLPALAEYLLNDRPLNVASSNHPPLLAEVPVSH